MPLRPVSELGLIDATDVERVGRDRPPAPRRPTTQQSRSSRRSANRNSPQRTAPAERPKAGLEANGTSSKARRDFALGQAPAERPDVPLADEPTVFLQIMVPGELQERLGDVSHVLAAEHRTLRHHKTILGALLWRYVEPDDPERLRHLGAMLDAYPETDLSAAPAEIKVGAHVPFSLKYKLEGAALALRRTRRAASAKTLLSALIWRYIEVASAEELVDMLLAYHEMSRRKPLPLGSTRVAQEESQSATHADAANSIGAIS